VIGAECGQQARQGYGPDLCVRLDLRSVRSGVGFLGFTERGGMTADENPGRSLRVPVRLFRVASPCSTGGAATVPTRGPACVWDVEFRRFLKVGITEQV